MSLFAKKPMNFYTRRYCQNCNLIWPNNAFELKGDGFVMPLSDQRASCPKCGRKVQSKDYNPWKNISDSLLTVLVLSCLYTIISVIFSVAFSVLGLAFSNYWIFGFLIPVGAIGWFFNSSISGFKQWNKIKDLV